MSIGRRPVDAKIAIEHARQKVGRLNVKRLLAL